jgi:hypothetical protein
MPKINFPVLADGLVVEVLIGLDGETTTNLVAAGRPITVPILARGEIDTGSNVTAVSIDTFSAVFRAPRLTCVQRAVR